MLVQTNASHNMASEGGAAEYWYKNTEVLQAQDKDSQGESHEICQEAWSYYNPNSNKHLYE